MRLFIFSILCLFLIKSLEDKASAHVPSNAHEQAPKAKQIIEMAHQHKPHPKHKKPRLKGKAGASMRGTRTHKATEAKPLTLLPATVQLNYQPEIQIRVTNNRRIISSNIIPSHKVGMFPHRGNPNAISPQRLNISLPLVPERRNQPLFSQLATFGIALNGVVIEPGAAEWYLGQRGSKWQYEALGGAIGLSLDEHYAHVQPNGMYHYHGLGPGLRALSRGGHIGWAYDGYPIFIASGMTADSNKRYTSSYRLASSRGGEVPGKPDGAFVADYAYVEGHGSLDACNGTHIVTEAFPNGTYAYFLTQDFPFIPRCFMATPLPSAIKGRR